MWRQPPFLSCMIPQTFWRMGGKSASLLWSPILSFVSQNLLCILSLGKGRRGWGWGGSVLSFHPKVITPFWNLAICTLLLSVQLPGGMEGESSDPREWEQPCSFGMVLWPVLFPEWCYGLITSQPNPPPELRVYVSLRILETCPILCGYWVSAWPFHFCLCISILTATLSFLLYPLQSQCCPWGMNLMSFNYQVIWFTLQDVWKSVSIL